jgi:hypothetical protein
VALGRSGRRWWAATRDHVLPSSEDIEISRRIAVHGSLYRLNGRESGPATSSSSSRCGRRLEEPGHRRAGQVGFNVEAKPEERAAFWRRRRDRGMHTAATMPSSSSWATL